MVFHVESSCWYARVLPGADSDPQMTFHSFEEAKAWAIRDLEYWKDKIEGSLEELREATSITDLPYYEPPSAS